MGMKTSAARCRNSRSTQVSGALGAAVVAASFAILSGCTSDARHPAMGSDRYLFVELEQANSGELVRSSPGLLTPIGRRRCVDAPTYEFEERYGILRGCFDFGEDDRFLGILGESRSLRGGVGTGTASRLHRIPQFPYTKGRLSILGCDAQGTLRAAFGTNSVVLPAGQAWSETSSSNRVENGSEWQITDTATILNHGLQKRDDIVWHDPHYESFKQRTSGWAPGR
jgi:hypothetical protein